MAFLGGMDIAASGLTAQRFRMDTIAQNVSNMNTTRNAEGEPYRRRITIMQEREAQPFSSYFNRAYGSSQIGRGVRIVEVQEDMSEFQLVYDPSHPDAQEDGYVRMPNVDLVVEMTDMMGAYRSYEANVTAFNALKDMANRALEIGR